MTHVSAFRAIVLTFLTLTMLGTALAQNDRSPASQAVIAFMNILDHDAVVEAELEVGSDVPALTLALLDHLGQADILAIDIQVPIRMAVNDDVLNRKAFILYLTDLLNGTEPLETRDAGDAELILEEVYCGLVIPRGTFPTGQPEAEAVLNNMEIGEVVQQFIDNFQCILPGLRDTYGDPVE